MTDKQVKKTDQDKLKEQAKDLGIDPKLSEKGPTGISVKDAKDIENRVRFAEETRDKIRREREIVTQRATLVAESETLCIPIDLPEIPTELELARARQLLGVKKKEVRPSPETVAIEASKKGYYVFRNLEQKDATHTANPGGKYTINLVPGQIHVLSEYHVKLWGKICYEPVYSNVPTGVNADAGDSVGRIVDESRMTAKEPRWTFEHRGEAPQDAEFGLVTDAKILKKLTA